MLLAYPRTTRFAGLLKAGVLALFALTLGACASIHPPLEPAHTSLPERLKAAISAADLPLVSIGVLIQPAKPGAAALASHNAALPLQPGSTMKLMTSIAALDVLGPMHRGSAEWRASAAKGDVLAGPSVIRALGHPELNLEATNRWLKTLRDAGVRRIEGEVVIDRSLYSPARPDLGVPPFDESPEFRYNFIPDALSLSINLMGVRLRSNSSTVAATLDPPLPGVVLVPDFKLIDAKCADWEKGWVIPTASLNGNTSTVRFSGTFPRNCTVFNELNVLDRTAFAHSFLQYAWQSLGGEWAAQVRERRDGEVLPEFPVQARALAKPLSELVRDMNKRSDNQITRMVFSALAEKAPKDASGTTAQKADSVMRGWLASQKIRAEGLVTDNGSGLSRSERVSAQTLVDTLAASMKSKWAAELQASLPIVGVDGTMSNRGKGTAAAERTRVKTGTLRNAWAVAGYVRDANDELLIVAAIVNAEPGKGTAARKVLDDILVWAAGSGASGAKQP